MSLVVSAIALFTPILIAFVRGRAAAKRVSECVAWSTFEDEYTNDESSK